MDEEERGSGKGRLKLPDDLAADLLDFRMANYKAQEKEIIQEALREHIARRLQEPAMQKRFDDARAASLAGENVTVLRTGK